MSFEDTVDHFRDRKLIEQNERAERLRRRMPEFDAIRKQGYLSTMKNGGLHWRIRWLEIWPSTGKWINMRTKKHGRLSDERTVLDLVLEQVGPRQVV